MKSKLLNLTLASVLAIFAFGVYGTQPAFARDCSVGMGCRDQVQGLLRLDDSTVYNSEDYIVSLKTSGNENAPIPFTTSGWLGFDLSVHAQFAQVGIITQAGLTFWFVYAESNVMCLDGSASDQHTCLGAINQ